MLDFFFDGIAATSSPPDNRDGLALAVSMIAGSNVLAQDSKPPFSSRPRQAFPAQCRRKGESEEKEAAKTFEEFKKSVTKEPFQYGKYIVNGDTPISTDKELEEFYRRNVELPGHATTEFAVMNKLGVDIIWKPADKKASHILREQCSGGFGGFGTAITPLYAMADATTGKQLPTSSSFT